MIKKIYLIPLLFLPLVFVACNETEEPGKYDNWRERNEAFIDSLQQVYDTEPQPKTLLRVQDSQDKRYYIYYKIMEKGPTETVIENGQEVILPRPPYYNSKATMFYRGMLLNESVFSKAVPPYYYTKLYAEEGIDIFDQRFTGNDPSDTDSPVEFAVNSVVRGWVEVLQLMRPGDRYEVYVPYQSGYGETTSSGGIPGYSTLIFDMQMVSIDYFPETK